MNWIHWIPAIISISSRPPTRSVRSSKSMSSRPAFGRRRGPLANLLNTLRAAVPRLLLYLGQRYTNLMTARHVGRPPLNLEIIGKQQHRILAGEAGSSRKLLTNSILGRIQ